MLPTALVCLALVLACGDDDENSADSRDFSADHALEQARALAEEIGPRPAGSAEETAAAEYIREELASYGYEAELQAFPVEVHQDFGSDLTVSHESGSMLLLKIALSNSAPGAVDAPVVQAGLGYPEDFPGGTAGSIALMERGVIPFSQKVGNAEAAGAVAALIYNDESGPLAGRLNEPSNVPAATLSRENGEAIIALLEKGAVTGSFSVEFRSPEGEESHNVLARPEGGECRFVLGGHYDSVPAGPGANDNASGTAVVIEIARTLAARDATDGVCFALFGSEEAGLLGSTAYVGALSGSELDGIEAMLNFDMLAVGEGWPFVGSSELLDLAGEAADALSLSHRVAADQRLASDHIPFIEAGVPAMIFNCFCDPNYHTAADRYSFLAEERVGEAGALGLGLLELLRTG